MVPLTALVTGGVALAMMATPPTQDAPGGHMGMTQQGEMSQGGMHRPAAPARDLEEQGAADDSPTLGDLCHPDELELTTSAPEDTGPDSLVTVTATHVGERRCRVEGFPTIRLLSDDTDLSLVVDVREVDPVTREHVDAAPVWLTRGESAAVTVWWPSWGAAADLDARQVLQVGVGGGQETVDIPEGSRWDVVRSAEALVTPWQPLGG